MICMLLKQKNFAQQANLGCLETRLKFFTEFVWLVDYCVFALFVYSVTEVIINLFKVTVYNYSLII